jgi:hypothetical protein
VEFKSLYCGTCLAFTPEWDAVVRQLGGHTEWYKNTLNFAVVIVEHEAGLELAQQEGALDSGVPAVMLYDPSNIKHRIVVSTGEVVPAAELRSKIEEALHELDREQEGVRRQATEVKTPMLRRPVAASVARLAG